MSIKTINIIIVVMFIAGCGSGLRIRDFHAEKSANNKSYLTSQLSYSRNMVGNAEINPPLTEDWDEGFESVFNPKKARWPETPSYYINVTSKTDPTVAPEGGEAIFVLVPLAPDLVDTPEIRERYYNKLVGHMETLAGEPILGHEVVKRIYCVNDFRDDYNAYKGTALGLTHTLMQTALFRPSHRSKKVDNLYYTGHYTHPGIGMPMCLISSQILAKTIERQRRRD